MKTVEVITPRDKQEFHDFPKKLYKGDPCWVCPLDSMIEGYFDPQRNHSFEHGEAVRWMLLDDSGKTIGRIAAFIDRIRSSAYRQPAGGMGFFEVIENKEAAFTLFDTAREWLASRGMEAMDGPINFGENDNYWGLLIEGFMQQGFGMPYNKKYYREFFESYGFRDYFRQLAYHRTIRGPDKKIENFPERIMKIAEWLSKRPGYSFRHFEIRNRMKYFKDICDIYNSTWTHLKEDFTPLGQSFLEESLGRSKSILDEELIWFAYFNDKPIGFFVLIPDLNQILRHLNGRLTLWNIIRLYYYKITNEMTRVRAVVGGVEYSYQNTGVESAIFYHLYQVLKRKKWLKEMELSWVGDYNPKMLAIYEALGAKKAKIHVTYRYMINKNLKFMRYVDEMAEKQDVNEDKNKEKKTQA
jgi:GNAT superfamily N-acetyltransferase